MAEATTAPHDAPAASASGETDAAQRIKPPKLHPLLRFILIRIGISIILIWGVTVVTLDRKSVV